MSAFGQAGFGSRNRQNQLRAQGQMDPYGNQVRQAKQAPTFNLYSQQPVQQQTSRPASRPAPAQPPSQPTSMPAYPPPPQTGGPMPTMGQAQPTPPASVGTPYGTQAYDAFDRLRNPFGAAAQEDPRRKWRTPEENAKIDQDTARFNEIQDLRRRLQPDLPVEEQDKIQYRLHQLENNPQHSGVPTMTWEQFSAQHARARADAPRAAQYKDRERFLDQWLQEQRRAGMTPEAYAADRKRGRDVERQFNYHRDAYANPLGLGRPYDYDAEMARRFQANRSADQSDQDSQRQFLAGYQPQSFDDWYAQRYGEQASQKWNLLYGGQ